MKKIYTYLIFSFALLCSTSLIAQTNEKARETAVMIADRILKSGDLSMTLISVNGEK